MNKCGDCIHFEKCKQYTDENETYAEVGGCKNFMSKMSNNNLTDNEIVKALECCDNDKQCTECPMNDSYPFCDDIIGGIALDLINRQKARIRQLELKVEARNKVLQGKIAEIERLKTKNGIKDLEYSALERESVELTSEFIDGLKTLKAEAYKEFAERVVSKIADVMKHIERNPYDSKDETKGTICGLAYAIGQTKDLLKELIGE